MKMVKVVGADWLAQRVGNFPANTLLLDARRTVEYSQGYINSSVHVSCEGMIRRRLKKGTLKIESLLYREEDKVKYVNAKNCGEVKVVICDQNSYNTESLAPESMALLILNKISTECKRVAFLEGGYNLFCRLHSELCYHPLSSSDGSVHRKPGSLVLELNSLPLSLNSSMFTDNTVQSPMDVSISEHSNSYASNPFKILTHLYLGCRNVATCLPGLRESNVTRILNVTSSIPNHFQSLEGFVYKQIAVEDNLDVDMTEHFSGAFQFIEEARACGEAVLVHCHAGRSRSVTIILAYLMKYYRHTLESALEYVKQRKPDINPNISFIWQLQNYVECSLRPSPTDSGYGSSPVDGCYYIPSPTFT